jgi:hypothetical protein
MGHLENVALILFQLLEKKLPEVLELTKSAFKVERRVLGKCAYSTDSSWYPRYRFVGRCVGLFCLGEIPGMRYDSSMKNDSSKGLFTKCLA